MTEDFAAAGGVADTVTLRGVHAYLMAHGWTRTGRYRIDRGDVYGRSESRETVLVPASTRFADFPVRIRQLAEILARTEDRRPSAVLVDLSLAAVDLIRVRLPRAHDDHSLALDAGIELLSESRMLLLAAACSALRPQRRFRAGRHERASTYLAGVRLGQTEPGSFVVNLLVPVAPPLAEDPIRLTCSSPPSNAAPTGTLVTGLRAAREATDLVNRGDGIQAFDQRVADGVSANLCTAAATLIDVGGGLEVSVSWALTRPANDEHDERRETVDFRPADAPVLHEAAQILSARQERVDEHIEGYVSALARAQSDPEGRATIKAPHNEELAWSASGESRGRSERDRRDDHGEVAWPCRSELDEAIYPTGRAVTDEEMDGLSIKRDAFHGDGTHRRHTDVGHGRLQPLRVQQDNQGARHSIERRARRRPAA